MTGANTYTGGTTVNTGGVLQIGNGGTAGSIVGNVTDNGALAFNRYDATTFVGAVSGTGSLALLGPGTLTLTGANTYTGGTTVSSGTLVGNTTSLQGAIIDNGALEFAQTNNGTFAGVISGAGSLAKTGPGTLILTGTSAIRGPTIVRAGRMSVQGVLGTSGLTVATGATLGGSGAVIGNVLISDGGTISPGNSPGALTVAGNVTLAAGSTYAADIDGRGYSVAGGAGSYDRIGVTNNFTAGGLVAPILRGISGSATNSFTPVLGDAFTIVTAGTVAGTFSGLIQPTSGLADNQRLDVLYGPNAISLVVTPASYGLLAQSSHWIANAAASAAALDRVRHAAGSNSAVDQPLFAGLYGLNGTQLASAFQQLSGEVYADEILSNRMAQRSNFKTVLNNVGHDDPLSSAKSGQGASCENRTEWIEIVGDRDRVNGDTYALGFTDNRSGFVAGFNPWNSCNNQVGLAIGYVKGGLKSNGSSSAAYDSESVLFYGAHEYGKWSVRGAVGGSVTNWVTNRQAMVLIGGPTSAKSSQTVPSFGASLGSRYKLIAGPNYGIAVIAALQAETLRADVSQEAGIGANNLVVGAGQWSDAETKLGFDGNLHNDRFAASLATSWTHEIGSDMRTLRAVNLEGAAWDASGINPGRDGVEVDASLYFRPSASTQIKLGYAGFFGRQIVSDKASITAVFAW